MLFPEVCMECEACISVCPQSGASPPSQGNGRADSCTVCGACVDVCPMSARQMVGQKMTQDEIFDLTIRDQPFYGAEGGVTFCGGEPLLQWKFLAPVVERLQKEGLHVAFDTCAAVSRDIVEAVPDQVDLILADLKLVDADLHRTWTGRDNADILAALQHWDKSMPGRLWISVPIVPNVQDEAEIDSIADFLSSLLNRPEIRILPYERFGESKYLSLGLAGRDFEADGRHIASYAREAFAREGLNVLAT